MASLRKALLAGIAAIGIGARRRRLGAERSCDDRAGSGRRRRADPLYRRGAAADRVRAGPGRVRSLDAGVVRYSATSRRSRCSTGSRPRWTGARRRCSAMPRRWPHRAHAGGVAEAASGAMPPGEPELFLCLDDLRQRRMHAERPDHVARRRDRRVSSGTARAIAARRPRRRRAGLRFSRRLRSRRAAEAARPDPDAEQRRRARMPGWFGRWPRPPVNGQRSSGGLPTCRRQVGGTPAVRSSQG